MPDDIVRVLIFAALLALVTLGLRVAQALAARPRSQAIADWLAVARFSFFDVFAGVWGVVVLGVFIWAAASEWERRVGE